jgi:hypothetical protein
MTVIRRYIPFIRELDQYFIGSDGSPSAVGEQITATTEGAAPYYQFSEYQDELRVSKAQYEPLATAMGYSSVDGFLQSDFGAVIQAELDARKQELVRDYPTGFRMSQEFTNQDALSAQALIDLSNKETRSEGEDRILELVQVEAAQKFIGELVGIDPQLWGSITAGIMRQNAKKHAAGEDGRRFLELWDRLFAREYGPIARVA